MASYLHADPRRRTNVRFPGPEGELSGHLYRPPSLAADQRTPGVAMCGPISSVKEQTLPHYAERFADAGYTVLTFDPTSFGGSAGEPRARYRPARVIDDFAYAVDHLMSRSDVDPQRVAVVGVCMGGGYAVSLAAQEKRIRAVVSIAGGYDIGGTFQANLGVEGFADYLRSVNQLVHDGAMAGTISYVPTATPGPTKDHPIAAMPNQEAFDYYERTSHDDAPAWPRELTADSLPAYLTYNAVAAAHLRRNRDPPTHNIERRSALDRRRTLRHRHATRRGLADLIVAAARRLGDGQPGNHASVTSPRQVVAILAHLGSRRALGKHLLMLTARPFGRRRRSGSAPSGGSFRRRP